MAALCYLMQCHYVSIADDAIFRKQYLELVRVLYVASSEYRRLLNTHLSCATIEDVSIYYRLV